MTNSKPIHEIRLGAVKASIWANETATGPRHNVTIGRLYKDMNDDWRTTDSFGREDLLLAAKVLDLVHSWLYEHAD